jgi:hypothetical protein
MGPLKLVRARLAAGLLLLFIGCGTARFESLVKDYVYLAIALGERDPDSLDFYFGPPELAAGARRNPPRLEEIRASATKLAQEFEHIPGPRARRLAKQAEAVAERAAELLGSKRDFDAAAEVYFGLKIGHPDWNDQTRKELEQLLPGRGTLAARYAAFDEEFVVPPDRVQAVFERAVAGCRERTRAHLPLPPGEQISIEYVHDKPWSAFSRYQGNFRSVIQLNADLVFTVDRILDLACHETYPGHHAFNALHEARFVRGEHWAEWTVQPTFSPQSLASESLATLGAAIAFPGKDRVDFERDILFPLAGLDSRDVEKYDRIERLVEKLSPLEAPIARDFVDGKLEWARAAAALEAGPLMTHADETLKYIGEYRTYMLTYTIGHDFAARHVGNWQQLQALIDDPDAARIIIGR